MINLANAVVHDVESFPNVFTYTAEFLNSDVVTTWEISTFNDPRDNRDDRNGLMQFFDWCVGGQIPMLGFFSLTYDYPLIHWLRNNPSATAGQIYEKSMSIIQGDRFANTIWESDRFAPQIDIAKVHHFDNKAKSTSLKALEINMRSPLVMDSPIPFGTVLTRDQVDRYIIPYNRYDVGQTKKFAQYSAKALNFRVGLVEKFGNEAMNYNDTKIGSKILEQRLGDDVCYTRRNGRKEPRQTIRDRIALNDIIFPYIKFNNPEFQRVLDYLRAQVLTPDDIDTEDEAQSERKTEPSSIKTKGVFSKLVAHVGGMDFHFGTGGIHGSVPKQRIVAGNGYRIRDIDVEGLYPNIGIVNGMAPEHLGQAFREEYPKIPAERKTHAKGTVENASFKLAGNGLYGNTNNKFHWAFDPQYTLQTTINGQLMLCMLAEWLLTVPTFQFIQINTDGITYYIHEDYEPQAAAICKQWEAFTCLKLEDANYSRMWIRDVNNYVAEPVAKPGSNAPPALKQKGAYWHPDPDNYADSISEASPPSWHKDLSAIVCVRAAVNAMTLGVPVDAYIRFHRDPYDFMLRARVTGAASLKLDGVPVQKTFRYHVARQGGTLIKALPALGPIGWPTKSRTASQADYDRIMSENGQQWDERVCTKNKSVYGLRENAIEAGWKVADCCDMANFDWNNVNYDWYIAEARKLIIA